jgi:hypothetical protein
LLSVFPFSAVKTFVGWVGTTCTSSSTSGARVGVVVDTVEILCEIGVDRRSHERDRDRLVGRLDVVPRLVQDFGDREARLQGAEYST